MITLSLGLAACSGPAEPDSTPTPSAPTSATPSATPTPTPSVTIPAQKSVDGITVTGDFQKAPTIKFATPFGIDQTRSKVLIQGKGAVVTGDDSFVEVHYTGINGRDGKKFDSSFDHPGAKPATFQLSGVVPGFNKGLKGKKVGDRVLIAMPGSDAYDQAIAAGQGPAGMRFGDSLVFVVDILSTSIDKPTGTVVPPKAGLPPVTEANGKPVVTVDTKATPPSSLVVQPLIVGTGKKVQAGDTIYVRYQTISWKTGKKLENKFDAVDSGKLSDTISAWKKGVVNQPIGSRLLIVAPPSESYPNGSTNPPIEKGDTVVYLVDLVYATAAQ